MQLLLRLCVSAAFTAAVIPLSLSADAPAPCDCTRPLLVSGEVECRSLPPGLAIAGAQNPAVFVAEASGSAFVAAVAGLERGTYFIEIDLAETIHQTEDLRRMDVTCGQTAIARELDLFKAAGGFAKAYRLLGTVEHAGDSAAGPLAIRFSARKGQAVFSAIRILSGKGDTVACVTAEDLHGAMAVAADRAPVIAEAPVYRDPDQPLDRRLADLIRRMSLREKVGQMLNDAPAIERLGVPAYDYWNECLHGVARAGPATSFPQAIGLAAMWDAPLLHRIADTIATEARAKHHAALREGNRARYFGLTFWTPNINLFRDPRWGRGQETYGEDPFLTARLGVAFITGLQGDDPRYFKALACAKHFAVHSGPESSRHRFDAVPSERDFYDSYLPHFEAAVREGHVGAIMGAYNRVYGEPACSSPLLLTELLRKQWGFDGHVVSDCGAIDDIWKQHKVVGTAEEAAARAVRAGCNIECGDQYYALVRAVGKGLLNAGDIDGALRHVLASRFRLGMFDSPERVPFAQIPMSVVESPAHAALALQAARQSLVLLKNDGVLPLDRARLKHLAVIGANADSVAMLLGNYKGAPSHPVSILQGIRAAVAAGGPEVVFAAGCPLALKPGETFDEHSPEWAPAIAAARGADVVVYVGGLSPQLEGEEMPVAYDGFAGGDRTAIELPVVQTRFLQALQACGKPVVFVNCSGSAVALPWVAKNVPAILQAWYPGQAGGTAVADVLFGDVSPSGRLPVTFYRSTGDLPPFEDYGMANRTYRFFRGRPLFAFGHGLSYTQFRYGPVAARKAEAGAGEQFEIVVTVANVGGREGDEVVQAYVRRPGGGDPGAPKRQLCAFQRISLARGESKVVVLSIPASALRHWDVATKQYVVDPGAYEIQIGAASDDLRARVPVQVR